MTKGKWSSTRRNFLGLTAAAAARLTAATAAIGTVLPPSPAWAKRGKNKGGNLCFLQGTLIATPTGPTSIDVLRIGDLVTTAGGKSQPIRWIGRRLHRRTGASWQKQIVPVKIAAHAIAKDVPNRDLYVSPGHAVLIDGLLIRAMYLVNDISISRALPNDSDAIEYYQILLDGHDVIFAEGVPAETLLFEPGVHENFDNFQEFARLYPDDLPPMRSFAPFAGYGGRIHLNALMRAIGGRPTLPASGIERIYEQIVERAL